jgi:hypothetical protein
VKTFQSIVHMATSGQIVTHDGNWSRVFDSVTLDLGLPLLLSWVESHVVSHPRLRRWNKFGQKGSLINRPVFHGERGPGDPYSPPIVSTRCLKVPLGLGHSIPFGQPTSELAARSTNLYNLCPKKTQLKLQLVKSV